MSEKEIVISREEFVSLLSERLEDASDIGKMVQFVESAFVLQSDFGRPAYIIEVDRGISYQDVNYLQQVFSSLGVCACLVPKDIIRYFGTVTPESMGFDERGLDV